MYTYVGRHLYIHTQYGKCYGRREGSHEGLRSEDTSLKKLGPRDRE